MSEKMCWYVVHVHSGLEKKVAEQIEDQAKKKGLQSQIGQILIPTEEFVEIKKGVKVNSTRQFFPSYVIIQIVLTDDTYHMIKNTPKVTGFLGNNKGKPTPVSDVEVRRIMSQVEESHAKPSNNISFDIGEQIRVCEGPFSSFSGMVEEVDKERQRLKVAVSIFGRPTPVDLDFGQVEKV